MKKMATILTALTIVISSWTRCSALEIDLSIIAEIESSNNPMAISYRGAKYGRGLCQISEICLKEYNSYSDSYSDLMTITVEELFIPEVNLRIANWYMNKRIPSMLKHYGIEDTVKNRLWSYNAGIGRVVNGIMPTETKNYIEKYKKESER